MEINQNQTNVPLVDSKSPGVSALKKVEHGRQKENIIEISEAKRLQESKQEKAVSKEKEIVEMEVIDLSSAVAQVNEHVQSLQRDLVFSVDEESGRDVVTIVDTESEEVIKQIPSEEMLELARQLNERLDENDKSKAVNLFSSIA